MRRTMRDETPVTVTLPVSMERRTRARTIRWRRVIIAALTLLGAALLAAGFWLPAKAALAQHLLNRAWEATRDDHRAIARPWPWADTWPVARLTLPGGEPLTVLAGASGRNLAFAPALLDGSAPLGAPGVTVIAGHRDTHFRALERLKLGDEIRLERPDGVALTYAVTAVHIVDAGREALRLDTDKSVIALVTCWPFDALTPGGPLRYVAMAEPIS
jgi:sortase A